MATARPPETKMWVFAAGALVLCAFSSIAAVAMRSWSMGLVAAATLIMLVVALSEVRRLRRR